MECPHWMEPPPHKSKEKKKELQKKIRQLRQKKKKSHESNFKSRCEPLSHTGQRSWTQPSNAGSFVTYSPQRVGLLPADAQQVGCGWTELS